LPGGVERRLFGERWDYVLDGEEIASSMMQGIEILPPPNNTQAVAANNGTVVYAGPLGLFGNGVIINHGMGLSTVYGFLDSISVKEGSKIQRGEKIGAIGATGLAEVPSLYYELRVNGYPSRPIEWFDKYWVRDHIEKKIQDVKVLLGIKNTVQSNDAESEAAPVTKEELPNGF
jgi:murein DD-endopeptidase MepM/ murein hydrolase activator NlpD